MKGKVLSIAIGLFVVIASIMPLPSHAEVDWRRFEGEKINSLFFTAAYIDAWFRPMAKRFKKETGVTIRMEVPQAHHLIQPGPRWTRTIASDSTAKPRSG